MIFEDLIKSMFKNADSNKLVASIPMDMANPVNNTKVLFWTRRVMDDKNAMTTKETALSGEYRDGEFWVQTDHWTKDEVFSWSKRT